MTPKAVFKKLLQTYCDDVVFIEIAWHELTTLYAEPHRHYHTLAHIQAMLGHIYEVTHLLTNVDAVLFACFYHDIIYNPQAKDNEHQSALYFQQVAKQISYADTAYVMQMIEATKAHELSADSDTNYLLDIDLSILGTAENIYQAYTQQIRKEYGMYADQEFYAGRKQAIEHFLARENIYHTAVFREKLGQAAKSNLKNECLKLAVHEKLL